MKNKQTNTGFTLIELLVVIAIIALLMLMIMPLLAKCKELAKRVICQSFQHQFVLATIVYSNDYDSSLPSFTAPSGPHVHDISSNFMEYLNVNYGLDRENFYCPSVPKWRVEASMNNISWPEGQIIISYDYWVPRMVTSGGVEIPPKVSSGGLVVVDSSDYQGPRKTTDSLGILNPVITDNMQAPEDFLPPQKLSQYRNSNLSRTLQSHHWRGKYEITNQGFVDGHVDKIKAGDMTPRYGYGNGYIWR